MGLVHAEIELFSADELGMVRRNLMDKDEVKRIWVNALVDSGSTNLAINEDLQEILQLREVDTKTAVLANGELIECKVVGPIEVRFQNRRAVCDALVLPGSSEPLLGALPMEEMDVLIHPQRQELVVNPKHPEGAVSRL